MSASKDNAPQSFPQKRVWQAPHCVERLFLRHLDGPYMVHMVAVGRSAFEEPVVAGQSARNALPDCARLQSTPLFQPGMLPSAPPLPDANQYA